MNSKEKLAQALLDYLKTEIADVPPEHPRVVMINNMITRAMQGYYSDFDSPLATPCVQLVKDLGALGLEDLKVRTMNGEFDATIEESDAWYEREGKAMIEKAFGKDKAMLLFGETKEEKESKEGIPG